MSGYINMNTGEMNMHKEFTSKEIVVMRKIAADLRQSATILRENMTTDYSTRLPDKLDDHARELELVVAEWTPPETPPPAIKPEAVS